MVKKKFSMEDDWKIDLLKIVFVNDHGFLSPDWTAKALSFWLKQG